MCNLSCEHDRMCIIGPPFHTFHHASDGCYFAFDITLLSDLPPAKFPVPGNGGPTSEAVQNSVVDGSNPSGGLLSIQRRLEDYIRRKIDDF